MPPRSSAPSLVRSFLRPASFFISWGIDFERATFRLSHSLTHSVTRRHRPWETDCDCENVSRQRHPPLPLHPRFNKSSLLPSFRSSLLQFWGPILVEKFGPLRSPLKSPLTFPGAPFWWKIWSFEKSFKKSFDLTSTTHPLLIDQRTF